MSMVDLDGGRVQMIAGLLDSGHPEAAAGLAGRYALELRPRRVAAFVLDRVRAGARGPSAETLRGLSDGDRALLREGCAAIAGDAGCSHRERRAALEMLRALREPRSAIYSHLHLRDAIARAHAR